MELTPKSSAKLGLVLSGGGAKGAYEVGVVKALAKFGIEPSVISGASIGALNGAIIVSAPDMKSAAQNLEAIWTGLDEDVLQLNKSASHYVGLAALHVTLRAALTLHGANAGAFGSLLTALPRAFDILSAEDKRYLAMLDSSPLEDVLSRALDWSRILDASTRELYVSVYPSKGGRVAGTLADMARWAAGSGKSVFLRLKDHSQQDALKAIMASAALPLAFKAVEVGGVLYRDGGMGGRVEAQGNTPAQPLVDAGCTHAIVTFLSQGVLWNRTEWPSLTPLEIRPSSSLDAGSATKAMLNFDRGRIRELICQGEEDALGILGRVATALGCVSGMRKAQHQLDEALGGDPAAEVEYQETMGEIRKLLS